jgi:hypothetical protein
MKFVELNRWFAPYEKGQDSLSDFDSDWGPRYGGWTQWTSILTLRRVVVLAEASSGKSEEFKNQARQIREQSGYAFFLRIEELADSGLNAALEVDDAVAFARWRKSNRTASFFLDAVDEARLNRKSFEVALKNFRREIGAHLDRANLYISCRVTDWDFENDRDLVERLLPAIKIPREPAQSPEAAVLAPIFDREERSKTQESKKTDEPERLAVYQLAPLDIDQCKVLAKRAGVPNAEKFGEALDQIGLDAYSRRPGDVLDLAAYWIEKGRFGPFAEMIEHSIAGKLKESSAHRVDNGVLTLDEAWSGAERLAAALTFGKSFTIKAPSAPADPSLTSGAIDPSGVFPEWTDAKRQALLRRGVFAPATYGRIRFHHRSTQEYLAARWLDRLIRDGCPPHVVDELIFVERYGVKTVPPSLRACVAWLCLWRPHIMKEVLDREPLTLLQGGDPGSMSLRDKERLLLRFADLNAHASATILE